MPHGGAHAVQGVGAGVQGVQGIGQPERAGTAPRSLGEIAVDVAELERAASSVGVSSRIAQAGVTLSRAAIDLLSRSNYAIAGFVDEWWTSKDFGSSISRSARELFSGIGEIQGDKEAFAEVFEQHGVGTLGRLSNALPFLKGTLVGEITGREAAGIATDILADPLTWMTFGVARSAPLVGGRFLSRQGIALREVYSTLPRTTDGAIDLARVTDAGVREAAEKAKRATDLLGRDLTEPEIEQILRGRRTLVPRPATGEAAGVSATKIPLVKGRPPSSWIGGIADDSSIGRVVALASEESADKRVLAAIESGASHLLDRGGIKLGGHTIVASPIRALLDSGISADVTAAIGWLSRSHPLVASALASTAWLKERVIDPAGRMFTPAYDARGYVEYARSRQAYLNTLASTKARWAMRISSSPVAELERSLSPDALKDWVKIYERGGAARIAARYGSESTEHRAAVWYADAMENIRQAELRAGIKTHARKHYFAHFYDNAWEAIEKVIREAPEGRRAAHLGDLSMHTEERVYRTLAEAEYRSAQLARLNPSVTALKPVWSPSVSLLRRGEHSISTITWRGFTSNIVARYGAGAIPVDPKALFELSHPVRNLTSAEFTGLTQFFRQHAAVSRAVADNGKLAKSTLAGLSDNGKREFIAGLLREARSRDDLMAIREHIYGDYEDFFPVRRKVVGDVDAWGDAFSTVEIKHRGKVDLPRSIARDVTELNSRYVDSDELRGLARGWASIQNIWKSSVTLIAPAFHVRNLYSNLAQSMLDVGVSALDPKLHANVVRVLRASTKEQLDETIKIGERTYTIRSLREVLDRQGVLQHGAAYLEYVGRNAGKLTKHGQLATKLNPIEYARRFGAFIENESRVQLFLNNLRRGLTETESAARVNKFLFDYQNGLTNTEQRVFKQIFPFYTWQSKNLRLMFDQLVHAPGRIAAEVKPFRGRESENEQFVKWEADDLKLRLDGDGRTVRMVSGIDLPVSSLDLLWNGNTERTWQQLVSLVSPAIRTPFEAATGVNLFLGRALDRKESDLVGRMLEALPSDPVRDWLGYAKNYDHEGRPRYTFDANRFYLFSNALLATRVISTGDRQWREWLTSAPSGYLSSLGAVATNVLTGMRPETADLHHERRARFVERERQLREALIARGALVRFERAIPPASPVDLGR